MRHLAIVFLGLAWVVSGRAELYNGNNAPGSSTNILVEVDASTTNISFILSGNATSYSHLLVKKDSPPLDTSYDFSSQVNGQTNAIHLELPELSPGFYYVRVRTPLNSQTHAFSLRVDHNSADLRGASRPVTKPLDSIATGLAGGGSRQYFRLEAPSGTPWQVRLTPGVNDTVPDVYVQWNQLPSETVFLKSSVNSTNDYLGLSPVEVTGGAYYIAVLAPAGATTRGYTMTLERNVPKVLPWDNGLTHEGTQGYSSSEGRAGDYYFQITTGNPSLGAWRTSLRLLAGEAALYLKRGAWPTPTTADYKSERPGSDGFILSASQFNVNEVWYVLVRATEGAQWSLVSGSPYVLDLGTVAANDASGSGPVEIGPEGLRYFRATATADMLAWRLWLKSTNLMTNAIFIKKASLPFPVANGYELLQSGQMLVVPPYLVAGQQYLVGVLGSPGQVVDLDCRQQPVLKSAVQFQLHHQCQWLWLYHLSSECAFQPGGRLAAHPSLHQRQS